MSKVQSLLSKVSIGALVVLIIGTVVRLVLGTLTPLYFQPDVGYDDMLMVEYAEDLADGNWLGPFSSTTLVKSAAFSMLLAAGSIFHIPYPWALTVTFIASVAFFSLAWFQLTHSKRIAYAVYLFLLFTPVMFHEENVQKIYRGGYIIVFTLLVVAAIIGMYANRKKAKGAAFVGWCVLGMLTLPIFWLLKEDSIWLLPFVVVGLLCTAIGVLRAKREMSKRIIRAASCAIPLVALAVSLTAYQTANLNHYGEYTVNDRSGTYYKEVVKDLMRIDDPNIGRAWVTHQMMKDAIKASPSLQAIEPLLEDMYSGWAVIDGEIEGDMIIWTLRESFDRAAAYNATGRETNNYYRTVDAELKAAFEDGRLRAQKGRLYLSSIARGYTASELIDYYLDALPKTIAMSITYAHNRTAFTSRPEPADKLAVMEKITNTQAVEFADDNSLEFWTARIVVAIERRIVAVYKFVNPILFVASYVGLIYLVIASVRSVRHRQFDPPTGAHCSWQLVWRLAVRLYLSESIGSAIS